MTTTLAERITKVRNDAQLNKVKLAARLRVSISYISQLESGKPYHLSDQLLRLFEIEFKVNPIWLEYGTGEPYKERHTDPNEETLIRRIRNMNPTQRIALLSFLDSLEVANVRPQA